VPALVSARPPCAALLANASLWNALDSPRHGEHPLRRQRVSGWRSPVGSQQAAGAPQSASQPLFPVTDSS